MKQEQNNQIAIEADMMPEYDFTEAIQRPRGRYAERYAQGNNIVVLNPELSAIFPDSASVNEALTLLVKLANMSVKNRVAS